MSLWKNTLFHGGFLIYVRGRARLYRCFHGCCCSSGPVMRISVVTPRGKFVSLVTRLRCEKYDPRQPTALKTFRPTRFSRVRREHAPDAIMLKGAFIELRDL